MAVPVALAINTVFIIIIGVLLVHCVRFESTSFLLLYCVTFPLIDSPERVTLKRKEVRV